MLVRMWVNGKPPKTSENENINLDWLRQREERDYGAEERSGKESSLLISTSKYRVTGTGHFALSEHPFFHILSARQVYTQERLRTCNSFPL